MSVSPVSPETVAVEAPVLLREVQFLPVALPVALASELASRVSRQVSLPCRVLPPAPPEDLAMIEGRDQVDADRLLRQLEARPASPGVVRVALTGRDLAIPIFTFVFGRARRGGSVAVVSLARLDPQFLGMPADPDVLLRRAAAEVLHEVGHVSGLDHCRDAACLMSFAADVETIDLRGVDLCPGCLAVSRSKSTPWLAS